MGGCYTRYSDCASSEPSWKTNTKSGLNKFFSDGDYRGLMSAYKNFFDDNDDGFIQQLLDHRNVKEAPKEFPDIEYEIKFNVDLMPTNGKAKEPTIEDFLDAFDFSAVNKARFLKDPVHNIAEGTNCFIGEGLDERLVVINKKGKLYLKEKSGYLPLQTNVPYEQIIIKRSEKRWETSVDELVGKIAEITARKGEYKGSIRKEKGDDFILDVKDGRIYSFTINRSHLKKPGNNKELETQIQLEIEYAGYVPGFKAFSKDDEKQLVSGMIELAKYIAFFYNHSTVGKGWEMTLSITNERKYDFVSKGKKELKQPILLPPLSMVNKTKTAVLSK